MGTPGNTVWQMPTRWLSPGNRQLWPGALPAVLAEAELGVIERLLRPGARRSLFQRLLQQRERPEQTPGGGTECRSAGLQQRTWVRRGGDDSGLRSPGGVQVVPQDRGHGRRVFKQGAAGSDLQVKIHVRDGVGLTSWGLWEARRWKTEEGSPGPQRLCRICRMACGL